MDRLSVIASQYLQFANREARGRSPSYEAWCRAVAADRSLLAKLAALPAPKQQPNLLFAALRWHGAQPGDPESLRETMLGSWDEITPTIMERSTQTNEPARCAALLPLLHQIPGPIALIELGASAGLCLIPDRYSYAYSDGTTVHPRTGPSDLRISCRIAAGTLPADLAAPRIAWRVGIDLNPLDPADPGSAAWLETLIWPEHEHRRRRLAAALRLAAAAGTRIDRGDLVRHLPGLVAQAPPQATLVIQHSSTLWYLSAEDRTSAVTAIADSGARWISFEVRGLVSRESGLPHPETPDTMVAAALDGTPLALANSHADTITLL